MSAKAHPDIRITQPFKDIYLINPYSDTTKGLRSPRGQVDLIVEWVKEAASEGLIKTVIWDTITNTAASLVNEFAREKVNKDDSSKHYTIERSKGVFINTPGINWRDNGMAQNVCKYNIRDQLLHMSERCNVIIVGHEVEHSESGTIGMDAGGPKSAVTFPGGKFSCLMQVIATKEGRFLAVKPQRKVGLESSVIFKTPPGGSLPGSEQGLIPIPPNFEGSTQVWRDVLKATGQTQLRCGLFGKYDSGKSALASAFLGLHGALPVAIVMSDQQLDLQTWWPDVKQPVAATSNEPEKQ